MAALVVVPDALSLDSIERLREYADTHPTVGAEPVVMVEGPLSDEIVETFLPNVGGGRLAQDLIVRINEAGVHRGFPFHVDRYHTPSVGEQGLAPDRMVICELDPDAFDPRPATMFDLDTDPAELCQATYTQDETAQERVERFDPPYPPLRLGEALVAPCPAWHGVRRITRGRRRALVAWVAA